MEGGDDTEGEGEEADEAEAGEEGAELPVSPNQQDKEAEGEDEDGDIFFAEKGEEEADEELFCFAGVEAIEGEGDEGGGDGDAAEFVDGDFV